MSKRRSFNTVWIIERRPLRGSRNWRAIEWPLTRAEGAEKVRQYNRSIADSEYRLTRYSPHDVDAEHFSRSAALLRSLLEYAGARVNKKEREWLLAEQRRLP